MMRFSFLLALLLCAGYNGLAQVNARILQFPDVSKTHITFSYGGDIWIVDKKGGIAHRLTTASGMEVWPRFSPDGSQIAFSGNYDGNDNIYVIPSLGGLPNRITHHGMVDRVVDWYPNGQNILFVSSRESGKQRFSQFYKVSQHGGLPEKLIVPYGEMGSLSADGNKLAYTPRSRAFRTWKRYRGGMAADVWIFDLNTKASENISHDDANDEFPMWSGNKIYFLSDRGENQRFNIWSYDIASKQTKQITDFNAYDIHFPSLGEGEIVFEAGGILYLLNLSTEKYEEVKITAVTDETALLPRKESVSKYIQSYMPSYDGTRAVFEARGDIFSVPAENGPVINLTQTSGAAERYPAWSPDGRYIAYWSDKSGEYELTLRDLKNGNTEKKLTSYGPGYRYQLFWSPNSKFLAFIDKAMQIYLYDIDKSETTPVHKQTSFYQGRLRAFTMSWSPDSRYLAYEMDQRKRSQAIAVFDVKEKKEHQLTSGFYNDREPFFDPKGKYLYFLTSRDFNPSYSDIDGTWIYANSTQVAAVPLALDTKSPIALKNDTTSIKVEGKKEDNKEDDKKDSSKKGKKGDDSKEDKEKKEDPVPEVKIAYDGFENRIIILTPEGGNLSNLSAVEGKVIFQRHPLTGSKSKETKIVLYDFKEEEEKTIVDKADRYELTADSKKMMVASGGSYYIVDVAPAQKLEKSMPVKKMEMTIVPKEEWKQIFNEAWRLERDFFYDPNMHGVDWNAVRIQYGKLLEEASTRWDVNFVIGEMIGEMNASHTYRGGGDNESAPIKDIGYLGIDWGMREGAYYVKRIVEGAPWDVEVKSALSAPGLKIKAGDYILAVNGVMMDVKKDPYASFEGLAEETVELTINSKPTLTGSWKVLVKTLSDETRLRNLEWIESNRKRVEVATQGRVGYVYVPSTGIDGQTELVRMFNGQFDKEGMIIDERFNNGGQIPDRFIEMLNRKPLAYWAVRDGENWQWPQVANFGPKVMLINGWSGSGGDAFPSYFKKEGIGPLIGTRTWGGLIGISGAPPLVDGGVVTVPTFRMYDEDGTWFREGHGVDPDIEVIDDPTQLANGVDPQLERAIEETMRLIKEKPYKEPKQPAYEKR